MLTAAVLDRRLEVTMARVAANLRTDGRVEHLVQGVRATTGALAVAVLEAPDLDSPRVDLVAGVALVPGPLRDHTGLIGELFTRTQVAAAVAVGEFSTLMEPRRRGGPGVRFEGVYVAGCWPKGRYQQVLVRRLERDGRGRALLPVAAGDVLRPGSVSELDVAFATSWLAGCLRT